MKEAGITDPDAVDKMAPQALKTAIAWGEKDAYGYNEEILKDMYRLCL